MIQITSQQQLDDMLNNCGADKYIECFVALNGGCRSSKDISFNDDGGYYVFNYIDDSHENIPHDELMQSFPIGEAISKGALYAY